MEISVPRRLLDAGKKNKLMVMMQIVRVMTRMTVLLKVNLERRHLLLIQRKKNQITRKKKKRHKKNGKETKDKLLPPGDSGEETYEELFSVINSSTAVCNISSESDWEVPDFMSSDNSCKDWLPWRLFLHIFLSILLKMTSVINNMIFIINKKTLWVLTIAIICSKLASLWKFQYFQRGLYIAQSNIYDGGFIAKKWVVK